MYYVLKNKYWPSISVIKSEEFDEFFKSHSILDYKVLKISMDFEQCMKFLLDYTK